MQLSNKASSSKPAVWARPMLASAALAAIAFAGGCTVHVHDHEDRERVVYRDAPPPQQAPVVVEQPAPEPVTEVVYEPAPVEVVTEYEPVLTPYGRWVVTEHYGRCWVYSNRPQGWRPYTRGHWVASDTGWLWVAEGDEVSWGQTCYHYGRWYEDPAEGWVWVPGRVWAPSWCAWREGGGYSAWAPLPPECGDGHVITVAVVDRYVPPERFVSVRTRDITVVNVNEHVVVNNVTIIKNTKNITNITYVNNRAVNRGVPVAHVQQATGRPVKVVHPSPVKDVEEARRLMAAGKPVMYMPAGVEAYAKTHPIMKRTVTEDHKAPDRINEPGRDHPELAQHQTAEEIQAQKEREAKAHLGEEHKSQEQANQEKLAQEKAARDKAALERKDEHLSDVEKANQERMAKEKAAGEHAAEVKSDAEKTAMERQAREKAALEQKSQEKAANEKAAQEKIANEKATAAEERANREKMAQEKRAAEKAATAQKAQEKADAEKAAAEARLEKEKAAQEKAAEEKAAREAKNKPKTGNNNPDNNPNNPNDPKKKRQPGDNTPPPQ